MQQLLSILHLLKRSIEALKTNFFATAKLCKICKSNNVPKFVSYQLTKLSTQLISWELQSDYVEVYSKNLNSSAKTKFLIVRFGNVFGSTGSVVPLFEDQIKRGPITITHPRVSRYFMTIREAVELVLISSQIKESINGQIFILEMGEPVLIKDLAKRMILLLGKEDKKIDIEFTGLRKGEKLSENLFFKEEKISKTEITGIIHTNDKIFSVDLSQYNSLLSYIQNDKNDNAIKLFKKILPEYQSNVRD